MDTKTPLFDAAHCEPDSWESLDYEGKVLAMRPDANVPLSTFGCSSSA